MIEAPIPVNDAERLNELYKYELLDTVYEKEFDEIVLLASRICQVPISLISLIDMNRQWFKAKVGMGADETARSISFCGHAIMDNDLFEVPDAATDERFSDNPLVKKDPSIRYYGGMPLVTNSGYKIGTLCVIDRVPCKLDKEQSFAMEVLSKQVIKLFELRLKNKELKKISAVQEQIITILAHDIRNPLAGIKSTLDLRKEGMLTEEDQQEIDALTTRQLDSTIDLLDNVVNWGKLQLSDLADEISAFSLQKLCTECFDQVLLAARNKKNELVNEIDRNLEVRGNRQAIEFMIRNLLGNAVKFTAAGTITVSAGISNGGLAISIKDTGVGMSEKAKESLQQRTWTATELGTQREKGSGVGLKLIFEYLQGVNGNITIYSAPEEGTEVVITLPI